MGILLSLLSAIFTAIGSILIKKGYKNFSPFAAFVVISFFGLFIWPLSIFFVEYNPQMLLAGLLYGALSGLFGQGYYIYVLSKGELSITGTLLSTFPIFTIIFFFFLNNESLSGNALWAILLTIIGTIVVALPSEKKSERIKPLLIFLPISAAIGIGFSDTLAKTYINAVGASNFLVATAIMQFIVSLICFVLAKGRFNEFKIAIQKIREYKQSIIGAFLFAVVILFMFLAFEYTDASIASPIIGSSPVFLVVLARIFLKEKLSKKNMFGIVFVLSGIILASL